MKKNVILASLIIFTFAVSSCDDHKNESTTATTEVNSDEDSKKAAKEENKEKFDDTKLEKDSKFVVEAANGGMYEVEVSKLALKNASSKKVKEFAAHIIEDHTKANEELMSVATSKNITVPVTISDKCQGKIDDISKKQGAEFDKAYASLMVDDHKEDIQLFEKEADNGNDADLKKWASEKVPTLKHHLEMAETLKAGMKN